MRRLFLSAGLVAGLLLGSTPAMAQTAPKAAPSARALALSERYVKAVRMDEMMEATLSAMDPRAMFKGELAKSEDMNMMFEASQAVTRKIMPKISARMAPLIAEVYTEDELQAMVDFYETPTGQSILAKTPAVTKAVTAMTYELMPEMMTGMVDEYCARKKCTDKDKAAMKAVFGL